MMEKRNYEQNIEIISEVTFDEINKVIHKLKLEKATGLDTIQNECIKQADVRIVIWKLISKCFETSLVPIWLKAIVSPIPKGSIPTT